jgi:hypothetical protein
MMNSKGGGSGVDLSYDMIPPLHSATEEKPRSASHKAAEVGTGRLLIIETL